MTDHPGSLVWYIMIDCVVQTLIYEEVESSQSFVGYYNVSS